MFRRKIATKSAAGSVEDVKFRCLNCHTTLKGKRNIYTRELRAAGLRKHIKLNKVDGVFECMKYYEDLKKEMELQDHDFTSSLITEKKEPTATAKRPYEEEEEEDNISTGGFSGNGEKSSTSGSEDPGQFEDVMLPKSNSLKGLAGFSNQISSFKGKQSNTKVDNGKLDTYTYPSRKLFPPMSYETILDYAKSQGLLPKLEGKARSQMDRSEVGENLAIIVDEDCSASSSERSRVNLLDYDTGDEEGSAEVEIIEPAPAVAPHTGAPVPTHQNLQLAPYLLNRLQAEEEARSDPAHDLHNKVKVHLQLLQMQEKHKMSFAAVDDIITWARTATSLQPNIFADRFPTRPAMIEHYRDLLGLSPDAYKFQETVVEWLPDNKPLIIPRRPFLDCVYELLTKQSLQGDNSCNISLPHPTNPYAFKPDQELPTISEVHQGTWWRKTSKQCCKGPIDVLCPVAFEVDETYLDKNGRLTVTPFNIRLLLYNIATNKSEDASTTWFFLPNDEAEAAHHEGKTVAHHKIQNLHNALRECFKDLKHIMDNKIGIPWKLTYAGKEYDVNLKFALAFIVSDTAMHDKLCCHFGVRNSLVKAICRHCDCETEYLSSWKHFGDCTNWKPEELDPTIDADNRDEEYWKSISHYPIKNAVDELYHGTNVAKTHLNTCGEVLHMHQKGAMVRVIESFVYVWKKGTQIELDNVKMSKKQRKVKDSLENLNHVGHQMGAFLNRQSDREKSRTKFKNSLFVTTKKCAHEQQGVLLCVLLALLSDRGRQICIQERTMVDEWMENQIYVIELILMVEVWMKKDEFPREHLSNPEALGKAIGSYMDLMTVVCPRDGMGTRLVKFHLMFHVPEYVLRWGPPTVVDSSMLEKSHKTEAKGPARLTQQRPETFMTQLPARYSDRRIVKRIRDFFRVDRLFDTSLGGVMEDGEEGANKDTAVPGSPVATGSPFTIGVDNRGRAGIKWKKRPGRQTHLQAVQDIVVELVLLNLPNNPEKVTVRGFTEYKVFLHGKQEIFRAHPSYRSASRQQRDVWYDWAMFDLPRQQFGSKPLPGQILMFVHVPFLNEEVKHKGIKLVPNSPHAVVRLFEKKPSENFRPGQRHRQTTVPYSILVKFGTLRDHFMIIPCKRIIATAIVVPNIETRKPGLLDIVRRRKKRKQPVASISPLGPGYFVVEPRFEWGEGFGRLIDSYQPPA